MTQSGSRKAKSHTQARGLQTSPSPAPVLSSSSSKAKPPASSSSSAAAMAPADSSAAADSDPLLYACVAFNSTVLTEHAAPSRDSAKAAALAPLILPKIPHDAPKKLTYTHADLHVHYIAAPAAEYGGSSGSGSGAGKRDGGGGGGGGGDGLTFLCVARADLGRRIPFGFLSTLRADFLAGFPAGSTSFGALPPYGCASFNSALRQLMAHQGSTEAGQRDALAAARREVDGAREVMTESIERVLERGERIDTLVDKTGRLGGNARDFRVRSRGLSRRMWWKNVKLMVILALVLLLLAYLLVGMGCGLPAWGRCTGH